MRWLQRIVPLEGRRPHLRRNARILAAMLVLAAMAVSFIHPVSAEMCPWQFEREGVDRQEFFRFDYELREALSAGDAAATALLINFPLRVNDGDRGTFVVPNARSLQARFSDVFPLAIRQTVLETDPRDVSCFTYWGASMYGQGQVWIGRVGEGGVGRFAVTAVNLGGQPLNLEPRLEFVCHGDEFRAIVESYADYSVRLRAWEHPRLFTDAPDIDSIDGEVRFEGTGPFVHKVWEFNVGDMTTFLIVEDGVYELVPLHGFTGAMYVSVKGEDEGRSWCY